MLLRFLLEEMKKEPPIEEAMWWVQRWITGSLDDPEWDETSVSINLDQAFHIIQKYVGNKHSINKSLWRYLAVTKEELDRLQKTKVLNPHQKSFQSFTTSKVVASRIGNDLNRHNRNKGKKIGIVVEISPPRPDQVMFGMNDLHRSKNGIIESYIMALGDWFNQDEIVVKVTEPLRVTNIHSLPGTGGAAR